MNQTLWIFFSRVVDFTPDGQNKAIQGVRVHYLNRDASVAEGSEGYPAQEAFLPLTQAGTITAVPGLYDGTFEVLQGKKGASLKLRAVRLIRACDLAEAKDGQK